MQWQDETALYATLARLATLEQSRALVSYNVNQKIHSTHRGTCMFM